jgi:hypothetical protein
VADFHRLPEHPFALVQNGSQTRKQDDSRSAFAEDSGGVSGFPVYKSFGSASQKTAEGVGNMQIMGQAPESVMANEGEITAWIFCGARIYSLHTSEDHVSAQGTDGSSFHRRRNQAQNPHRG